MKNVQTLIRFYAGEKDTAERNSANMLLKNTRKDSYSPRRKNA